jgi:hypothetical protein
MKINLWPNLLKFSAGGLLSLLMLNAHAINPDADCEEIKFSNAVAEFTLHTGLHQYNEYKETVAGTPNALGIIPALRARLQGQHNGQDKCYRMTLKVQNDENAPERRVSLYIQHKSGYLKAIKIGNYYYGEKENAASFLHGVVNGHNVAINYPEILTNYTLTNLYNDLWDGVVVNKPKAGKAFLDLINLLEASKLVGIEKKITGETTWSDINDVSSTHLKKNYSSLWKCLKWLGMQQGIAHDAADIPMPTNTALFGYIDTNEASLNETLLAARAVALSNAECHLLVGEQYNECVGASMKIGVAVQDFRNNFEQLPPHPCTTQ